MFMGAFALAAFLFASVNFARADQAADATAFVRTFGDRTVELVTTPADAAQARVEGLRRLVLDGLEIEAISRFVLGRGWSDASETDRTEYRRAYEDYIVRTLSQRLTNYGGETLNVGAARPVAGGDLLVVSTITRPANPPIKIDWRVRPTAEGFRIVDLIVEGLSLVVTQRDEFATVLRGGGLPALVKTLRQRSASL
jgi:phospholipid transport system substrate-binding protein